MIIYVFSILVHIRFLEDGLIIGGRRLLVLSILILCRVRCIASVSVNHATQCIYLLAPNGRYISLWIARRLLIFLIHLVSLGA